MLVTTQLMIAIDYHSMIKNTVEYCELFGYKTFFKISSFVLNRRKKETIPLKA